VLERPDSQMPPLFDLTPERRDAMIEGLVQRIVKAGMGSPALIFLESQRPLGRIGGNILHILSPFIGVFVPSIDQYGHLLQDPVNLEIIVNRLQELEEERGRQQRALRVERKARARERRLRARGEFPSGGGSGGGVGAAGGSGDGGAGRSEGDPAK
jgi:hypothetical protein